MSLYREIHSQPEIVRQALDSNMGAVREIARAIEGVSTVFIAARGTSDNAARYMKYLWGMHNRLPVMLAAPSMVAGRRHFSIGTIAGYRQCPARGAAPGLSYPGDHQRAAVSFGPGC